jgi:hypothetical protein
MQLRPLPDPYVSTRDALHRVAVHVLARRRHALCGKFGLRATPGGLGTPAGGPPDYEVVRTSGRWLVRERTGKHAATVVLDLGCASLGEAAAAADVDVREPFSVGRDTLPVGDVDAPLDVDDAAARALGTWYGFGSAVLDAAVTSLPEAATPAVVQVWPEHFDAGIDVSSNPTGGLTIGASPGNGHLAEPYLYVQPWNDDRPGAPDFWNATFGAVLGYGDLLATVDPFEAGVAFARRGLMLVVGG